MLNEIFDIDEICTTDSVDRANELLQDGWSLLGFHPASSSSETCTVFVMARLSEFDDLDSLDDEDLIEDLDKLEILRS